MTCHHPLKAYKSRERNPTSGRYQVTFNPVKSLVEGSSFSVPCGRCTGCRIAKAQEWAIRCQHEAQMHPVNSMVNLTYDDKNLPHNYSVVPDHLTNFLKRLRKSIEPTKIRYFAVGEYGSQTLRPHYHLLIFNYRPHDLKYYKTSKTGHPLYISESLSETWTFGHADVGSVTAQSAGYVARYNLKKVGEYDKSHTDYYTRQHPLTGEYHTVEPEFARSSRRGGLGSTWFAKFKTDCFPSDFVIVDGRKKPVPSFYTRKLLEEEQRTYKIKRKLAAVKDRANSTKERLAVREEVLKSKINLLKRD